MNLVKTLLQLGFVGSTLVALTSPSAAQDIASTTDYAKLLGVEKTIEPVGDTPFGEQISLYTGEVKYLHSDVVVPGNGPTISLVRNTVRTWIDNQPPAFADWQLSIPRIETLVYTKGGSPGANWIVRPTSDPDRYKRCTYIDESWTNSGIWVPWWFGIELFTESGDSQRVLQRGPQNTAQPSMNHPDGSPVVFPAVTTADWQVGCLPSTANSQLGEGFLVVSPEGTKYWFNYLVGEPATTVTENDGGTIIRQQRMLAKMYVSRIEDRFGNFLTYNFGGDDKLDSISASDGRNVTITWRSDVRLVDRITVTATDAPPRVWIYTYASHPLVGMSTTVLSQVTLPDNSKWTFSLHPQVSYLSPNLRPCNIRGGLAASATPSVQTITNPSGAVGTFTFAQTWHAHSYVISACVHSPYTGEDYEDVSPLFYTFSLIKKEVTGPGLQPLQSTYSYMPAQGSTISDPCAATGTCVATKWVDVVDPSGNRTRYTHSNRADSTDGHALQVDTYQGAGTLLRSQRHTYAAYNQGPWPNIRGYPMAPMGVRGLYWMPMSSRTITQQGRLFKMQVTAFDAAARPTAVTRSSESE